ncbi:AbrB/MazE/SpoVT family DNA-binding domain-containing protein [Sphingomonas sanguinis]|uniref:AbrB/MazE/SpoVT family DNA-binding domain-containing protein n=1 Tax=Sphingomonas sanguinis TaxID=33051 RepID=A0ABU5LP08_9SPHN|nr:AbrB/MazE/SpoVT family DNA-binding domain-containing protein [Sphingomonas sanguinis]MDZ7281441.1 AbrB/MazE/SpoVT family DNA-binding domain-containing protein [Sphingomonas sanguinis]QXT36628.1 AbrB/MazE/SpoVT family DNA-binding domain-containing protein [Sphingomonas sanguinis]
MGKDYQAKVFRSGNSLALRLPAALGLAEGTEMTLREEQGRYVFEPVRELPKTIDLTGIAGSMPWLKPIEREDFDDPERPWHLLNGKDA